MARIPKCRCHLLRSRRRSRAWCCISCASTVIPLSQPGSPGEYKKSGKKLDMGKGCVRFKSLEDLALDVVGRTVARVSVEEHMANYRAARALLGRGRNAGEGAAGLSKSSAKKAARKSAVKKAKPKK